MKTHSDVIVGWHPFTEGEIERYSILGYWHNLTICDVMDRNALKTPDKLAIADDKTEVTWKELQTISNRLALHLLNLGVKYGDFFLLQLPNIVEFFYMYFGLNRIGAIPIMCLPRHRKLEINEELKLHRAVGVCVPQNEEYDYINMINEIRNLHPYLKTFLTVPGKPSEGWTSLEDLLNYRIEKKYPKNFEHTYLDKFKPSPNDICTEQLSGGTTGVPKGIPRTHNDYICTWDFFARAIGFNDETIVLCVGPVAHNAGLSCTAGPAIWTGGSIILTKNMHTENQWKLIEKYKVNCAKLFPILISRWIYSWKEAKNFNISSLRIIGSGGTKVRPEYVKWILDQGWEFVNIFGMAEGPIIMTRHQSPREHHLNTIGKTLIQSPDVDVKLVNEKNKEVEFGEIGEMKMQGPITFKGYFRNAEENTKAFDEEGYFHSGDLMSQREDGVYVVEGRKKDMIKRGGENVYPEPIQDILAKNPKILTAACVGMPDPMLDERLCAFVQLVAGKTFTFREMREYMKEKGVAVYKWPERLEIVEGWPLTAANKISKRLLRAWITTKLYKEGKIEKKFGNKYLKPDKITIDDILSEKLMVEFTGTPR